jgi:hypothetical protein
MMTRTYLLNKQPLRIVLSAHQVPVEGATGHNRPGFGGSLNISELNKDLAHATTYTNNINIDTVEC